MSAPTSAMKATRQHHRTTRVRGYPNLFQVIHRGKSNSRVRRLDDPESPSFLVATVDLFETSRLPKSEPPDVPPSSAPCPSAPNPESDPSDPDPLVGLFPSPAQARRARYAHIRSLLLSDTPHEEIAEIIAEEHGVAVGTAEKDTCYVRQSLLDLSRRQIQELRALSSARLTDLATDPETDPRVKLLAERTLVDLHGLSAPTPRSPQINVHYPVPGPPSGPDSPARPTIQHLIQANPRLLDQIADVEAQLAQALSLPAAPDFPSDTPAPTTPAQPQHPDALDEFDTESPGEG